MQRRILFIRLSAVGDVINTLPALSVLRAANPDATIGYVVEDKAKDVVLGHPLLDEVFVFEKKRLRRMARTPAGFFRALQRLGAHLRRIRASGWDVSLDCQGTLKGALHSWFSGAPKRIGFSKGHSYELNTVFSTIQVSPPTRRMHRVEKFLRLLEPLGMAPHPGPYHLPVNPESSRRVDEFLGRNGAYMLVHPGTSGFAPEKRWPPERYGELAGRLVEELGLKVFVTWGPGEQDLAEQVSRHSGGKATPTMPTRSLLDLAELIRRSSLFVSADTGPMHLAAACEVPCVALFGPKDPVIYRPYGEGHRVITHGPGTPMDAITVDEVFEATREQLGAKR